MPRIVIKEGLETPEQRAWFFAHLGDEEERSPIDIKSEIEKNRSHKWLSENDPERRRYMQTSREQIEKLTSGEKKAIRGYVDDAQNRTNQYIRDREIGLRGISDSMENRIKNLDLAIDKNQLTQDTILYHGFNSDQEYPEGAIIKNPAYTSTSESFSHATLFTSRKEPKIMVIEASKGQKGLYSDMAKPPAFENEIILPRGLSFEVVKVEPMRLDLDENLHLDIMLHHVKIVNKSGLASSGGAND